MQVFLITDACHAGALAGSKINGTQKTLAAALLNESQQVVFKVLNNDPAELARVFGRGLYRHIPGYLERAAELLGTQHYMYRRVKGLQHLFEAYNLLTNTPYPELAILQNKAAIPRTIQASALPAMKSW